MTRLGRLSRAMRRNLALVFVGALMVAELLAEALGEWALDLADDCEVAANTVAEWGRVE